MDLLKWLVSQKLSLKSISKSKSKEIPCFVVKRNMKWKNKHDHNTNYIQKTSKRIQNILKIKVEK